jgi:hypothetical protein
VVTITRDGRTLELTDAQQRVLETALSEMQRAVTNRCLHARREGRMQHANDQLVYLDRLQTILDFLLMRASKQVA